MVDFFLKLTSAFVVLLLSVGSTESCEEELCGSIVSKCMILKSCECDMKDIACRKECIKCLSDYHGDCCSCVGMCLEDSVSSDSLPSNIGELSESVPTLFEALTSDKDPLHRWHTFSFPVFYDFALSGSQLSDKMKYEMDLEEGEKKTDEGVVSQNCTVAYKSQCLSWHKCRVSCQSMGAASYRWFHDGCCECIGENCPNYGINESRCENCPIVKSKSVDYNKLDFGENLNDYLED